MAISLATVALNAIAVSAAAAALSRLRAIPGEMTRLAAVIAVSTAAAAASLSRLGAIARQMPGLAAIVTIATAATAAAATSLTLRTLSRHMALLVAIVTDHGSALTTAVASAAASAATRLGAFARDMPRLATVVTRTVSHFY